MKSERSFACGQRVRTNCYMAIVQGYVYMYMHTLLPNVYLYYYICYCTTDVTTLVVSLTMAIIASYFSCNHI